MTRHYFATMFSSVLAAGLLAAPLTIVTASEATAQISIGLNVTVAPPELPIYEQPPLPGPGYIWTPGYWSYGDEGYYWVPGTWVEPPSVGLLWTPGYWGYDGGRYIFNAGYWGPHVGFYGGVDYGFGYGGVGFEGGYWRGGGFFYNRAVNNFGGVHVTNVYEKTVVNVRTVNRVSFNGPNGINVRPTPEQAQWAHERHVEATAAQTQHFQAAAHNRALLASVNHGRPAIAATARPGDFKAAVPARAGGMAPAPHNAMTPRPAPGPHPVAGMHPALAPHPAPGPRPAMSNPGPEHSAVEPRPVVTHPMAAPHPMEAPHAMAPRPVEAPHAMMAAPHPSAAPPHAAPEAHPAGKPGDEHR